VHRDVAGENDGLLRSADELLQVGDAQALLLSEKSVGALITPSAFRSPGGCLNWRSLAVTVAQLTMPGSTSGTDMHTASSSSSSAPPGPHPSNLPTAARTGRRLSNARPAVFPAY
jgi:hypothetical protein